MAQRYTEISYEKMILQNTKPIYAEASGLIKAIVGRKHKAGKSKPKKPDSDASGFRY